MSYRHHDAFADAGAVLVEVAPGHSLHASILLAQAIEHERALCYLDDGEVAPAFARMIVRLDVDYDPLRLRSWLVGLGSVASQFGITGRTRHGRRWELDCLSRDGSATIVLGPPA